MFSVKFNSLITVEVIHACIIDSCTRNGIVYLEDMLTIPCMRTTRTDYSKPTMDMNMYPWYNGAQSPKKADPVCEHVIETMNDDEYMPTFLSCVRA